MLAALDVGTNSVRLLLGEVLGGEVLPHRYFRRVTRLGGGFIPERGLAPEAVTRTLDALREAREQVEAAGAEKVRAVGTAILRRATDAGDFLEQVRSGTGFDLSVISGEEEARLSAAGVLAALAPSPRNCLIFDLGGGSTELVFRRGEEVDFHHSYPLGVVALAEENPQPGDQRSRIRQVLERMAWDLRRHGLLALSREGETALVGTAGTVTTLAAMHLGLTRYDWRLVNNLVLDRRDLRCLLERLLPLTAPQREELPGMEKGRGDLVLPGLLVVLGLMEETGKERLIVSDFGLLEGVLLALAGEPAPARD